MKKIVGIFAAAAVLATSVFAADVSAATKINGSVFAYGTDESISMLKEGNDSHDYANPNLAFNISDDRAGASIKLTSDGGTKEVKLTSQTIWFKPVEVLKISAGNYDVALNKEQIDWTQSVTGIGGNGFLASVNTNGFGLDIGFDCNEKFWMSKAKNADVALTQFFLKAGYSADFGTIGAYAEFNRAGAGRVTWAYHDRFFGYATSGDNNRKQDGSLALKKGPVSDIHFGAGYSNTFNGIKMFANVAGFMADKFEWVRPEIYVSGSADAFGYNAFIAPIIFLNSDAKKDAEVELTVKLTYAMDGITPYFYFNDENLLNKNFTAVAKVGATGSVGLVGYNVWAQIDIGEKVGFSVPFELTASF